ncbi:hypothetical protein DID78_05455 [Candidatus Marinamargulisbacteria bacterium SCGC AG-343-D04]|nr:hypothetical protein DID78_05455 [Candidatus Marinamargulisbacteria bacterium SCGC AG-343-D04]
MQISALKHILCAQNVVSKTFLESIAERSCAELYEYLSRHHIISEPVLHKAISDHTGMKRVSLGEMVWDMSLMTQTRFQGCIQKGYLPLFENSTSLMVGVYNPYKGGLDSQASVEMSLMLRHEMEGLLCRGNNDIVDQIIEKAIRSGSSDIHGYGLKEGGMDICMRINGRVVHEKTLSYEEAQFFIQKIKLEAKIDSGVSVLPQDGQMRWCRQGDACELRVSTLPTISGEDIVLRVLDHEDPYVSFRDLGMKKEAIDACKKMLNHKSGLVLITGATGSGKTTTIYALLRYLQVQKSGVIVSIEDPVEKSLYGVRQSRVNQESGYTYAAGLKAVLRQDPDVIMLGEIRDEETARIAIQAAYTGHLVISTLHTHDVESSLMRLKSLGCDEFLTRYVLKGILSQRLEPIVCSCVEKNITNKCLNCHQTGVYKRELRQEFKVFK